MSLIEPALARRSRPAADALHRSGGGLRPWVRLLERLVGARSTLGDEMVAQKLLAGVTVTGRPGTRPPPISGTHTT